MKKFKTKRIVLFKTKLIAKPKDVSNYSSESKKVTDSIPTRTANQIRAHTQKFFIKLKRYKDDKLGIDLTLDSIHNIQDGINHIKSKNINYSLSDIFLYVLGNRKKRVKKFENIESTKNKEDLNLHSNNANINNYIYNNNFNNFLINNNIVLNTIMNNDNFIDNFIYNNSK